MSNSTEIRELPKCATHGVQMLKRDGHTQEQDFCGTWYECPRCMSAVLFTSPELRAHLAAG